MKRDQPFDMRRVPIRAASPELVFLPQAAKDRGTHDPGPSGDCNPNLSTTDWPQGVAFVSVFACHPP